jgi:Tfp pilus assembly protein PilF
MRKLAVVCLVVLALSGAHEVFGQQVDPLVANSNDPLELQQLGVRFIATNQTHNALDALRKALGLYPDNAETRMWLGVVYTQMNEDIAAEGEFIRALELNPQLTEVHNWFGVYWARQGNFDAAIAEYRRALQDAAYPPISRARVQVNLGNVLMQTSEYDEAVTVLGAAGGHRGLLERRSLPTDLSQPCRGPREDQPAAGSARSVAANGSSSAERARGIPLRLGVSGSR